LAINTALLILEHWPSDPFANQ